jgi:hypothetical protein
MGVTIHYRGTIDDKTMVGKLADEMEDFAHSLDWETERWNEDWSKPNTARISPGKRVVRTVGHAPLHGITLYPHEHCEPLWLTFDPTGSLVNIVGMAMLAQKEGKTDESWTSTKTQFAPIETHIAIVKLLQYVKRRYVANLEVYDDGGYWGSGDVHELQRRIDSINRGLDILESALSANHSLLSAAKYPEELAEAIERIIRDKFGG